MLVNPPSWHIRRTWVRAAWFASYFAASIWLAASGNIALAQASAWKTGPLLRRQLDGRLTLHWPMRPLRPALEALAQNTGVAIFLDRRIDPDQTLDIAVQDETLEQGLEKIASAAGAQSRLLGSVIYIGPAKTAGSLATLAALRRQEAQQSPADPRARLLAARPWQWEELAEPRQLVGDLAREARVTIENPDVVPHDLWPRVSLPPLAWTDRLSLLLAGFDLTFQLADGGQRIRLVAVPAQAALTKNYTPRGTATEVISQLRRILPQADISREGSQIRVTGSAEDHAKVERLLAGETVRSVKPAPGPAQKAYSLTTPSNTAAGAVLQTIARQIGKEVKYDPALLPKLKENVTVNVKDVSLDELLKATLQPLGLGYRLTDNALEIISKE